MIKFENTEVVGWEAAIRGMRNPMNSWENSDSRYLCPRGGVPAPIFYSIGPNDHELMMKLANGGPVHAKYRRMIAVYADVTAPLYWWKEYDTYKVSTVANSCSTMHKIHAKEFTSEDFSSERLNVLSTSNLTDTIKLMNVYRDIYNRWDEFPENTQEMFRHKYGCESKKDFWWQLIQLLPSSYNQKRTIMLNYEVLANMYKSRKNHKLDEWRVFCDWIKALPYSEIITLEDEKKD